MIDHELNDPCHALSYDTKLFQRLGRKLRSSETYRRGSRFALTQKDRIKYRMELPVDRARMANLSNNNSKIVLSNGDDVGIRLSRESTSLCAIRPETRTWDHCVGRK